MKFRFAKLLILLLIASLAAGCTVIQEIAPVTIRAKNDDGVILEELQSFKDYQASHLTKSPLTASLAVQKLPPPSLVVTPEVRRELSAYLKGNGKFVKDSIARGAKYYPVMTQIFEDEGVPPELIGLALVESGFNIHARSHVGAVGMWQFMGPTAKLYGLSVGIFEDQRKDPILSTIAAARHLKDLYRLYKDWYLALAAYNAGPRAVRRVVEESGGTEFWALARRGKFSKQTRDFIPRFIAAALLIANPEAYGLAKSNEVVKIPPNVESDSRPHYKENRREEQNITVTEYEREITKPKDETGESSKGFSPRVEPSTPIKEKTLFVSKSGYQDRARDGRSPASGRAAPRSGRSGDSLRKGVNGALRR